MSKLSKELEKLLQGMDSDTEAKEILLRAAEIQANQGQTLETGETALPEKYQSALDVAQGKTDIETAAAKELMGGSLGDFQARQLKARDKDRWLTAGSEIADLLVNLQLVNKL